MVAFIKLFILAAWACMLAFVVLASPSRQSCRETTLFAPDCGEELEFELRKALRRADRRTRLVIIDDERDGLRREIICRLLVRHPGVFLRTLRLPAVR